MPDQIPYAIPYADYVRIEIYAAGKAEIIEFRPDAWGKVKAQMTVDDLPIEDLMVGETLRRIPASDKVSMTLKVSGPTAKLTCKVGPAPTAAGENAVAALAEFQRIRHGPVKAGWQHAVEEAAWRLAVAMDGSAPEPAQPDC